MHAIANKQFNFRNIEMVIWHEEVSNGLNPNSGKFEDFFGFSIHLVSGRIETFLFSTDEERKEKWESLIDSMEKAGF
ncbi:MULTISPECIES: hypothetical protein [unclassified Pseudoxanthomonas]|uniref:hypothetical protein n=1 Tax=unclassified Pseudoxanthomonas TaxID=2645906 RepID=UPI00307CF7BC